MLVGQPFGWFYRSDFEPRKKIVPHLLKLVFASAVCWLSIIASTSSPFVTNVVAQDASRLRSRSAVPIRFTVNPGWDKDRFPDDAVCYQTPAKMASIYRQTSGGRKLASYPKPTDGALRIVGTGHSFMAPGYQTMPKIVAAAGLKQPRPVTHTGGGMTGSARYIWEKENGIFQFKGRPQPLLLASIANAKWDAMMWGPYYQDRAKYYSCWIDFCLKYNPDMKFYLSDAWPQLENLAAMPKSEAELTNEVMDQLWSRNRQILHEHFDKLDQKYPGRVFVLPTAKAMVLAVKYYHEGKMPGVEGIHKSVGGKERSLWRDRLGHLGRGIESLEGYVFYATMYGRSPELIEANIFNRTTDSYPSIELDKMFRKIAWEAATTDPLAKIKK